MALIPFSSLTVLGGAPAAGDLLVLTDISDHTQSANGSTKSMTVTNLFTSPTMTGPTIASGGLTVSAGTTAVQALTATTGLFAGGNVIIQGSDNPYVRFDDSTGNGYLQVVAGDLNLAPRAGRNVTVSAAVDVQGSGGLAIGDIAGRHRIAFGGGAFNLVGDDNGNADLALHALNATGNIVGDDVFAAAGSAHRWTGRSMLSSPADGTITLFNNAQSDFGLLQFGGTTSSFPAWKRSGTTLLARLADDSDYAPVGADIFVGNYTTGTTHHVLTSTGATTQAIDISLANSGNSTLIGVENSTGGLLFSGASAYATVLGTASARSVQFVTNNAVRQTIDANGGTTFSHGTAGNGVVAAVPTSASFTGAAFASAATRAASTAFQHFYATSNGVTVAQINGDGSALFASTVTAPTFSGNLTGNVTGALSGNASTATALQTARTINGTSFNGTADITVTAAAGTLTGATLASGVTASSLTQVGTALAFGGTSASFPMFKRNGADLDLRLADDSGYTDLNTGQLGASRVLTSTFIQAGTYLTTEAPAGDSAGQWRFGLNHGGLVTFDNTNYVTVSINGNVVKLAVVT